MVPKELADFCRVWYVLEALGLFVSQLFCCRWWAVFVRILLVGGGLCFLFCSNLATIKEEKQRGSYKTK